VTGMGGGIIGGMKGVSSISGAVDPPAWSGVSQFESSSGSHVAGFSIFAFLLSTGNCAACASLATFSLARSLEMYSCCLPA